MKKIVLILPLLTVLLLGASSIQTPFVIDILGTSNFDDVAIIRQGLQRSDEIVRVSVSRSSRNYTQLEGIATGTAEHFLSDLSGLAQDRFSMDTKHMPNGLLMITLRKLSP